MLLGSTFTLWRAPRTTRTASGSRDAAWRPGRARAPARRGELPPATSQLQRLPGLRVSDASTEEVGRGGLGWSTTAVGGFGFGVP